MYGYCHHSYKVEVGNLSREGQYLEREDGSVICSGHYAAETKERAFELGLQFIHEHIEYHTIQQKSWQEKLEIAKKRGAAKNETN